MKDLQVIELEQRSDDWHHIRNNVHGLCTASNAGYFLDRDGDYADLMRDDYSLVKLYRLAKGIIQMDFTPDQLIAMDNGVQKEPLVRSILETRHKKELLDITATSKIAGMSHYLVSYDGLDYVENIPYEIKVSSNGFIFRKVAENGLKSHMKKYIPQVQMQIALTNATHGVLAVYGFLGKEEVVLEFKVERDDIMIAEILRNSKHYHEEYFLKDIEPPANPMDPILPQFDDEHWQTQAIILGTHYPRLQELKAMVKEAEAIVKKAETEIQKAYLADAGTVGGRKVISGMGITLKAGKKSPSIAWKSYAAHLQQKYKVEETDEQIKKGGFLSNSNITTSVKVDFEEFSKYYSEKDGIFIENTSDENTDEVFF